MSLSYYIDFDFTEKWLIFINDYLKITVFESIINLTRY